MFLKISSITGIKNPRIKKNPHIQLQNFGNPELPEKNPRMEIPQK